MPIRNLLHSPRTRRALAAGALVLSFGGLVLVQAPVNGAGIVLSHGAHATSFEGPGLSGSFALSHGALLAGRQRTFVELRFRADEQSEVAEQRAPLAMVIMLDTSGSMDGDKLADAKQSVVRMLRQMDAGDEVAFVRYDSVAELVQPMARVGDVRESLIARVERFESNGGTNISAALDRGRAALAEAGAGRVRRLVLVSDGLDDTRAQSESLAHSASEGGASVSTLGIGLDFDESYLAAVARAGEGNFAFVDDTRALSQFLERELTETSSTTIEGLNAEIDLPAGVRLVSAVGAETSTRGDRLVISVGSLHRGDERRVVLELEVDGAVGQRLALGPSLRWRVVGKGGAQAQVTAPAIEVAADPAAVDEAIDRDVLARCISALASRRQLEAAEAFRRGDRARALQLADENVAALREAQKGAASPEVARSVEAQADGYQEDRSTFSSDDPGGAKASAAVKRRTEKDNRNLGRSAY
jgi:Ca-activated chloride channel family protein